MIATEPRVEQVAAPAEMVRLTIHVTAEDIAQGKRNHSEGCAIALALLRTFNMPPTPLFPSVSSGSAFLPSGERVDLPEVARAFILDFDSRRSVEPFDFDLEIPLDAAA